MFLTHWQIANIAMYINNPQRRKFCIIWESLIALNMSLVELGRNVPCCCQTLLLVSSQKPPNLSRPSSEGKRRKVIFERSDPVSHSKPWFYSWGMKGFYSSPQWRNPLWELDPVPLCCQTLPTHIICHSPNSYKTCCREILERNKLSVSWLIAALNIAPIFFPKAKKKVKNPKIISVIKKDQKFLPVLLISQ